jgi:hypothetical protein
MVYDLVVLSDAVATIFGKEQEVSRVDGRCALIFRVAKF